MHQDDSALAEIDSAVSADFARRSYRARIVISNALAWAIESFVPRRWSFLLVERVDNFMRGR